MKVFRISMVIASLSPLFIIWAISGQMPPFQGVYFEIFCIAAVIVPNAIWRIRLKIVKKKNDTVRRTIWKTVDSSHYLFTYLLTMLMPFYVIRMETYREFLSVLFALGVVVFLFWRFNPHYMNIFLALCGYHILTVTLLDIDNNPVAPTQPFIPVILMI